MTSTQDPTPSSDLESRIARLQRLVEISLILNSTLELEPLLRYIMDAASEMVGSESASILLVDRNTRDLVFTASSSNAVADLIGHPVPREGSIAGAILKENRAIALDDVRDDPRHYRGIDRQLQFQTRSLLGVPLSIKHEVIGVLEAVNKKQGRWTQENRNALLVLANQAAVAINNAQLVNALRRAYAELDQLDKLKNDFISIASHELRTPLGVILGYASFLKDEAQGESSAHAQAVFRSALQLRSIIEQMTNLRYLKVGEAELQPERVAVAALMRSAEGDIASLAATKNHTLTVRPAPEDCFVMADPIRIGAALGNILNNAVKFTPAGGQIVMEAVVRRPEVWITIRDSGIGIPADQLEKIFNEFYQVEDHMTRRYGGIGLGLSIARALVVAHHGRIWAESPGADQGSTFYICLPLAVDMSDSSAGQ